MKQLWMMISSPWMIAVFLMVGWGPVFLAELVGRLRPDLDAAYVPQAFVMSWIREGMVCSVLAIALSVIHGSRLIIHVTRLILRRGNNE